MGKEQLELITTSDYEYLLPVSGKNRKMAQMESKQKLTKVETAAETMKSELRDSRVVIEKETQQRSEAEEQRRDA